MLNASARCKISAGIWEISFQLSWFFTSCSAGLWADGGSQAGQENQDGHTAMKIQAGCDISSCGHRMESFLVLTEWTFPSSAGHSSRSVAPTCEHAEHLKVFYKDLANSSCDVPACEGLVKASQGKPGWNCCFSIVFYRLSLREKMLHLNYSTASSLGLPHVGSGDQEGSAPTKRWEKKSRSKSWNLWPLQVVSPLP